MSWLASLALNWRLIADSARSPACETTESTNATAATAAKSFDAELACHNDAAHHAGHGSADCARPGLVRTDARHQLRSADRAPDEIGRDVGQPYDHEQEQDRGKSETRVAPQQHRRDQDRRRIKQARRRTTCGASREASAATPKKPSATSAIAMPGRSNASSSAEPASATRAGRQHGIAVIRADQRVPFPQHGERGDGPERDERDPAEIGRRDRERRQHQRRHDAQHEIAAAGQAGQPGWILVGRLRAGHGYEPVCAINPPNRRSRR